MENPFRVAVCLSAYNGKKYIHSQIASILNQTYSNFEIRIRDDGSTDRALIDYLRSIEKEHAKITVSFGTHVGAARSFLALVEKCPADVDFVILSDQDDVWYPTRIEKTIAFIAGENPRVPLLCFCRCEYVDENLNLISISPRYKSIGFNNALVQNLAAGCTTGFNRAAVREILRHIPRRPIMHDWWIYLVVSATGKVVQEPHVSIQYRQHGTNLVGCDPSAVGKNRTRLKSRRYRMVKALYDQLNEFEAHYGATLSRDKAIGLRKFLQTKDSAIDKILFLFDFKTTKREGFWDNWFLKIAVLVTKTTIGTS